MTKDVQPDHTYDDILEGQAKPTGEQLLWVFLHLCDLWESEPGQSYGFFMQRMYGYPSEEKIIAMGPGQAITNILNCAKDSKECRAMLKECYL